MCVSQPAMSMTMRKLEEECGAQLFVRNKNSVQITEKGKMLLREVEYLLQQHEKINDMIESHVFQKKLIRIGITTLAGNMVYSDILQRYMQKYPDVVVSSIEDNPARLFTMLGNNALDVVIASKETAKGDMECCHLMDSCRLFCINKDHPLAKESFLTIEQISPVPLVLLGTHTRFISWLKEQMRQQDLPCHILHLSNQIYTIERFVEKGIAGSILLENTIDQNPNIVGIPYEGMISLSVDVFWNKNNYISQEVHDFITVCKEVYPQNK